MRMHSAAGSFGAATPLPEGSDDGCGVLSSFSADRPAMRRSSARGLEQANHQTQQTAANTSRYSLLPDTLEHVIEAVPGDAQVLAGERRREHGQPNWHEVRVTHRRLRGLDASRRGLEVRYDFSVRTGGDDSESDGDGDEGFHCFGTSIDFRKAETPKPIGAVGCA
jgi:hypothetical protein